MRSTYTKVCLDTNFISDFLGGEQEAVLKFAEITSENLDACTTVITVSELFYGAYKRGWGKRRFQVLTDFLEKIAIIPFSVEASILAGWLRAQLARRGINIGYADTAIAAISLVEKAILLTRNVKHFKHVASLKHPISGIDLELHIMTW